MFDKAVRTLRRSESTAVIALVDINRTGIMCAQVAAKGAPGVLVHHSGLIACARAVAEIFVTSIAKLERFLVARGWHSSSIRTAARQCEQEQVFEHSAGSTGALRQDQHVAFSLAFVGIRSPQLTLSANILPLASAATSSRNGINY
jgi:hypothetical protein